MAGRPFKRIKRYASYVVVRLIGGVLAFLPLSTALSLGRAFGAALPRITPGLFEIALRQIRAHLDVDTEEAERIARASLVNAGLVAAELFKIKTIRRRFREYVTLNPEDIETVRAALSEGKGALFISAHLGNWELLAQRIANEGFECASLARRSPNPSLGVHLEAVRRLGGVETINRGDPAAARAMLGLLKRGGILGALIDQDTKVPSLFVPFFGTPAKTPSGPAELAIKRRLPVLLGFGFRRPGGGIRLEVSRLEMPELGVPREEAVVACVRRMSDGIESAIRRQPENWVWFHERWKSVPPSLE